MNLLECNNRIAVVALMGSGKTTLAGMLLERGFERIALADAVKDEACDVLNGLLAAHLFTSYKPAGRRLHLNRITRELVEEHKAIFRPFLQWLGTDFWRVFMHDPTHWIDIFRTKVEGSSSAVICDDLRFVNEAQALREMGFTIVKLIRNEEDRIAYLRQKTRDEVLREFDHEVDDDFIENEVETRLNIVLNHPSEQEVKLIEPDVVIANDQWSDLQYAADQLALGVKAVC